MPRFFISDPGYATTLYFDQTNKTLYWPNYEAHKIERIKPDGTSRADVVTTPEPISITVDITSQKIYWLDQSDYKIHRANTDGSGAEVFISDPGYATTIILPYELPSNAPTVSTAAVSNITSTAATLGGNVTADGGATVTERGVVYSTTDATPTIIEGAAKAAIGSGTGAFSQSVTGLSANTTYYVAAYAMNAEGTSYGSVKSFTTNIGTGWTEANASALVCYPNPTKGMIYLKGADANADIKVYNAHSQLVIQTKGNKTDLSPFASGMYILDASGVKYKIVKE
ncbi:MAG: T9SS type A sorting domain-containing protein [Paludibacteraceae bacterium]